MPLRAAGRRRRSTSAVAVRVVVVRACCGRVSLLSSSCLCGLQVDVDDVPRWQWPFVGVVVVRHTAGGRCRQACLCVLRAGVAVAVVVSLQAAGRRCRCSMAAVDIRGRHWRQAFLCRPKMSVVVVDASLYAAGRCRHLCSTATVAVRGRRCPHRSSRLEMGVVVDGTRCRLILARNLAPCILWSSSFVQGGLVVVVVGMPLMGVVVVVDSGMRVAVGGHCLQYCWWRQQRMPLPLLSWGRRSR